MVELTQGIVQTSKSIFKNNRGSLLRTLIYTLGHFYQIVELKFLKNQKLEQMIYHYFTN